MSCYTYLGMVKISHKILKIFSGFEEGYGGCDDEERDENEIVGVWCEITKC